MKITIDIPEAQKELIIEAVCKERGYDGKTADIKKKPAKEDFVKEQLLELIKEMVAVSQISAAVKDSQKSAKQDIDSLGIGIS